MRPSRTVDLYGEPPLRDLRGAQARLVPSLLQRCAGDYGLIVHAGKMEPEPVLPFVTHWVDLSVAGAGYSGDLVAAADEAFPFVDDAFGVVWLCHALERTGEGADAVAEAIRVLAPGGTLVVSGLHPLGAWAPWFCWRARGSGSHLYSPLRVSRHVRQGGANVEAVRRLGRAWPGPAGDLRQAAFRPWGGAYVLIACKQRHVVTPLRVTTLPLRVPASGRLSPSARRSATA